jgi:hypothetical protein
MMATTFALVIVALLMSARAALGWALRRRRNKREQRLVEVRAWWGKG